MPSELVLLTVLATAAAATAQPTITRAPSTSVQPTATCGWHFIAPPERPPTLEQLVSRADAAANGVGEAVALLERWYRGCDGTAAREAARVLRNAYDRDPRNPLVRALLGVALVRGLEVQVERARERHGPARRAAERAAAEGDGRAARVLGIVRLITEEDPAAGAAVYLDGLRRDPAAVEAYFDDLRVLLGEDELAEWRTLEAGRAEWIERKWDWRAAMAGVRVADRLAEHHRRLAHALKARLRQSYRGAEALTVIRRPPGLPLVPLDDRGLIYVRHGEPDAVMQIRDAPGSGRMFALDAPQRNMRTGEEPAEGSTLMPREPDRMRPLQRHAWGYSRVGVGVVRAQREIGAELEPGAYTVTLTVTNGRTNERVTAEARIVVVDRR